MSMFGMSKEGKNARTQLSNIATDDQNRSNQWANNSNDLYGQSNSQGDNVWASNYDAMSNGLGNASDAQNAGQQLLGDQSGDINAQGDRLNGVASNYESNYASPNSMMGNLRSGVGGARQGQQDAINGNRDTQQGFTNGAYGKVRGNLSGYSNDTNNLAVKRNSDLTTGVNSAYNAMDARNSGVHGAMVDSNNSTVAGAQNRLVGSMDANGAAQMRATAPLASSAAARMRASGVDPNSPEGASLMDHVNEARAHAADDNLASNIAGQNQLALGQDATNRGLALDSMNTTNAIAGQQNALNRTDTNQQYDSQQKLADTQLQQNNATDMGEYNDTRQNFQSAYGDQQNLYNTQANDAYQQTNAQQGMQQQDYANRMGMAQAQNGVNQQNMAYKSNAGAAGANWANGNFNAQQQARNAMQGQFGTNASNAQGWANQSQGASNAAAGNYNNVYSNESANSNWLTKGLISAAGGAAASYLGGPKK